MPRIAQPSPIPYKEQPSQCLNSEKAANNLLRYLNTERSSSSRTNYLATFIDQYKLSNQTLLRVVETLINQNNVFEAEVLLELVTVKCGRYYSSAARIAYINSEYTVSIRFWNKSSEFLKRLNIPDYFRLLDACEKTDDIDTFQKAIHSIQDIITELNEAQIRQLAIILHRNHRTKDARLTLSNLHTICELNTYLIAARIYGADEQHHIALNLIDEAIEKFAIEPIRITDDEIQKLFHCKINILLAQCEWDEAISLSEEVIKLHPLYFPVYQMWLRAIRSQCDHKAHLEALKVTYDIFQKQHPELAIQYSRELDIDGQSENALKIIEQAHAEHGGMLEHLLKKYLRDGLLHKFTAAIESQKITVNESLIILNDYLIYSIRSGNYEKISDIVFATTHLDTNTPQNQRYLNGVTNSLFQLGNILVSDFIDTSRLLCNSQKVKLLETINNYPKNHFVNNNESSCRKNLFLDLFQTETSNNQLKKNFIFNTFSDYFKCIEKLDEVYMDTYESPDQAISLSAIIKKRIEGKIPTSMIRLGDGEGNYLKYPEFISQQQTEDQRLIQRIWWGDVKLSKANQMFRDDILLEFKQSIMDADILGIPPVHRLLESFDPIIFGNGELNSVSRGLISIARNISSTNYSNKIITSCHVHTDLELWDCYSDILHSLDNISIITCHKHIDEYLRERFGILSVTPYIIPGESRYQKMFDQSYHTEHFPSVFSELCKTLPKVSRGQVFLVGAGFLSKLYCNLIKRHGGIALDVGSLMDMWAGYQTRLHYELGMTCQGLKYLHKSSIKPEMPITGEVVHSCISRNRQLTKRNHKPKIACTFLISGHPRSGTGYTASLFNQLGYQLGHESVEADGMASWMHAVADQNTPFFGKQPFQTHSNSRYDLAVEYLIKIVRNPRDVIPSIMLENRNNVSYEFRRFHILHQCGVDLENYTCAINCAAASYLYWLEILDRQKPTITLRLESIEQETVSFLNSIGEHSHSLTNIDTERLWRNTTTATRSTEKPFIPIEAFNDMDEYLLEKLRIFSELHDYEF